MEMIYILRENKQQLQSTTKELKKTNRETPYKPT